MRKYSVVVFDLGNVLLPFDYGSMYDSLNGLQPGLADTFKSFYKEHYTDIHRAYERGDISDDEFLEPLLKVLGNKVDRETFCNMFSRIFTVNEDVAALLPQLKKKYRIVLLSNTSFIHQQYGWKDYPFLRNFEKLFLSNEVRAVKPEPAIYRAVTAYTGLPSAEHIFIDDVAEYAEGARLEGWDAVQFKGYGGLVKELTDRGILPVL